MLFSLALALVAALYASIGQAGGTGYIAAMGLAGFSPDIIKPTALCLNILVAAVGTVRFTRAGLITWRGSYPFAILGVPFSMLGGAANLPPSIYQPTVGVFLLLAAVEVVRSTPRGAETRLVIKPPILPSIAAGAVIGFGSGVTGVGGGIILAPIVLAMRWVDVRQAAGLSAVFNLSNSAAALAGAWTTSATLPAELPWWLLAVGVGGALGSALAIRRLPTRALRVMLSLLLAIASLRMIVG